jgi:hypothetical protein
MMNSDAIDPKIPMAIMNIFSKWNPRTIIKIDDNNNMTENILINIGDFF